MGTGNKFLKQICKVCIIQAKEFVLCLLLAKARKPEVSPTKKPGSILHLARTTFLGYFPLAATKPISAPKPFQNHYISTILCSQEPSITCWHDI